VSFYYVLNKETHCNDNDSNRIEAIVAEVSNTPWNEMKCYVLHPRSKDVDIVRVIPGGRSTAPKVTSPSTAVPHEESTATATARNVNVNDNKRNPDSINYIFNKTFHVSPFMELDYIYDWTFWDPTGSRIRVSATMIKKNTPLPPDDRTKTPTVSHSPATTTTITTTSKKDKHFNAYFDVHRRRFTPLHLGYQLLRLPAYCLVVQIWIHIEAARLLLKGVVFIPHPEGAETRASRVIGKVMEPVFRGMDWLSGTGGGGGGVVVEGEDGDDKKQ